MKDTTRANLERRAFLKDVCAAAVASSFLGFGLKADARFSSSPSPEDAPATHNMLVVGEKAVYLSHLPMFNKLDPMKTTYITPHRYQVLLEATFNNGNSDLSSLYTDDRAKNKSVKIYTLGPTEDFVLPQVDDSDPHASPLKSFTATVFRGHLEDGGQEINKLNSVTVNIKRVIHFRRFDPKATKPARLEYLLFGRPDELFMSHFISKPPDFDQTLSVKISGHNFTEAELSRGVRVAVPGRLNSALTRLKANQQAAGEALLGGATAPTKLQITAGREFYFEETELRIPPSFNTTKEEKASRLE